MNISPCDCRAFFLCNFNSLDGVSLCNIIRIIFLFCIDFAYSLCYNEIKDRECK